MDYPAVTELAHHLYRFRGPSDPFFNEDDAVQEALIACWKAEPRWSSDDGDLMAFFVGVIRRRYRDLFQKATAKCRKGPTISLGRWDFSEDHRIVVVSHGEDREDRNQRIFRMREDGATLDTIGLEMGMTGSSVCKILRLMRESAEERGRVPTS